MSESEEVRELLARAEMHEKAAAATEDERARKLELAMAAELRRRCTVSAPSSRRSCRKAARRMRKSCAARSSSSTA
jgi:hypothetical protein